MNLFRKILLWFYYTFTLKGRKEKYWNKADKALERVLIEKGQQELSVKQKCIKFAENKFLNKRFSKFFKPKQSNIKIAKATSAKHKSALEDVNVAIDSKLNFKDIK